MIIVKRLGKGKDTAVRISSNHFHVLIVFPQPLCKPSDGTTGASASHNRVDATASLFPNFFGRSELVGKRVVLVAVLVENMGVWDLLLKAAGDANVRFRRIPSSLRWCSDDSCAKGFENRDLLGGHLLREGDDG